jgi:hypothetical protein
MTFTRLFINLLQKTGVNIRFSFHSGEHLPMDSIVFYRKVILTASSASLNRWTFPVALAKTQYSVFPHNSVSGKKQ